MQVAEIVRVLTKAKVVEFRSDGDGGVLEKLPQKVEAFRVCINGNGLSANGTLVIHDLESFVVLAKRLGVSSFPVIACPVGFATEYAKLLLELKPILTIIDCGPSELDSYFNALFGKRVLTFGSLAFHTRRSFVSDSELELSSQAVENFIKLWHARQRKPDITVSDTIEFAQDEYRRKLYSALGLENLVFRLNNQNVLVLMQNRSLLRNICDLIDTGYLYADKATRTRLTELLMTSSVNIKTAPFYPTLLGRFAALENDPIVVDRKTDRLVNVSVVSSTVTEHDEVLTVMEDGTVDYAPVIRYHTKLRAYLPSKVVNGNGAKDSYYEDEVEEFIEFFELPEIPTVADIAPEEMNRAREVLSSIEAAFTEMTGQQLLNFQREDLARLLVKGSGILAWDPGCGKTVAGLFFALGAIMMGKARPRVLVVAPQDLVLQWFREMRKFFGEEFASEWFVVDSVERAVLLRNISRRLPKDIPLYAITWYEALRSKVGDDRPIKREKGTPCPVCRQRVKFDNSCSEGCPLDKSEYLLRARDAAYFLKDFVKGGVLVVDEATYIKSVDSQRGLAARRLVTAACRLLLTGTPIKNILADLPMLLQLAAKPNSEAYPFPAEDTSRFSKQFMVVQKNLLTGTKRVGPEPTNVAVAQRMLSGIILRRTKDQTGEDIVPLKIEIQSVPLTDAQIAWYKAWCDDEIFERWFVEVHDKPIHPLAKMLSRMSHLLFVIGHPTSRTATGSPYPLSRLTNLPHPSEDTAKNKLAVELAVDFARQKGHAVLFAQTVGILPILANRIRARGVPVHLAVKVSKDGSVQSLPPSKRAMIISQFEREGGVLLASISAMAHGHDLAFVSRAIIHSLCFAYDNYAQAIMRVHRIISPEPVEVHVICCDRTLDVYLLSLLQRKEQAAKTLLENRVIERSVSITAEEWKKLWEQVAKAAEEL